MWAISRKARYWSPTFCLIFHTLSGSSQVCNSPLINSNLHCKDWIILYVAIALTNMERIGPFCKKRTEGCWPKMAPNCLHRVSARKFPSLWTNYFFHRNLHRDRRIRAYSRHVTLCRIAPGPQPAKHCSPEHQSAFLSLQREGLAEGS